MTVIRNLPAQWGRKRFLVGKDAGVIGTAVVLTDQELEQIVKEGAAELGWRISRIGEDAHDRKTR